jgi:hypothetical protein
MSPPVAAVSRYGPVVLRSVGAVCTNSVPVSLEEIVSDLRRPRPGGTASFSAPDRRGSIEGGGLPAAPEVLGQPGPPGDAPRAAAPYLQRGQEVACASTQGTLSSH